MEGLQQQIEELRTQLRNEINTTATLRRELQHQSTHQSVVDRPRKIPRTDGLGSIDHPSAPASISEVSDGHNSKHAASVIKHMGRLVNDESGIGRFAGSTTGAHFVSSVEALWQRIDSSTGPFDQNCFRLPFYQVSAHQLNGASLAKARLSNTRGPHQQPELEDILQLPTEHYLREVNAFLESWQAFCPIIPREQFARRLQAALNTPRSNVPASGDDISVIYTLCTILAINRTLEESSTEDNSSTMPSSQSYLEQTLELHAAVVSQGDLWSLNALMVFTLYLQMTRHTSWLTQMTGLVVRLAQSLGLHRHARRFRFSESEIELRKRMWWYAYGLDKYARNPMPFSKTC